MLIPKNHRTEIILIAMKRTLKNTVIGLTSLLVVGLPLYIQAAGTFRLPKPPSKGAPGTGSEGAGRDGTVLTALVPMVSDRPEVIGIPTDSANPTPSSTPSPTSSPTPSPTPSSTPSPSSGKAPTTPDKSPQPRTIVGGLTTLEQPTLWFYNPYPAQPTQTGQSQLVSLKFTLKDAKEQEVDSVVLPLPATAGLVSVRPKIKLEPDRPYHWIMLARVKEASSSVTRMALVDGWIQREVPCPAMAAALQAAKAPDRLRLYTDGGIWFEALDTLAGLRSADPKNKTWDAEWAKLLTQAGIPQKVIDCTQKACVAPT
jgi:Domain of Unknown Function (DUF928)